MTGFNGHYELGLLITLDRIYGRKGRDLQLKQMYNRESEGKKK